MELMTPQVQTFCQSLNFSWREIGIQSFTWLSKLYISQGWSSAYTIEAVIMQVCIVCLNYQSSKECIYFFMKILLNYAPLVFSEVCIFLNRWTNVPNWCSADVYCIYLKTYWSLKSLSPDFCHTGERQSSDQVWCSKGEISLSSRNISSQDNLDMFSGKTIRQK